MGASSQILKSEQREGWELPFFLVVLWGQFFLALFPIWWEMPSYRYGLVAMPLWVFMVIRRWRELTRTEGPVLINAHNLWWLAGVFAAVLAILVVRPLQQVDQFWRLPLWLHAFLVACATIFTLRWAFDWSRTSKFLRLFLFAAVLIPLPSMLEEAIAGRLTALVATSVGELFPLMGYPLDLVGNAVIVHGFVLDIAEGCSGFRSFQASFMVALFLGEFYQYRWFRRVLLLFGGLGLAIVGNGARIYYLSIVAYEQGLEAEEKIHEFSGIVALTFIYGSIGLLAWILTLEKSRQVRKRGVQ